MTPERWSAVKNVVQSALARPVNERADFVAAACGDDAALRGEVDALLAAHVEANEFLEQPAWAPASLIGTTVASYRILEQLGAGGMGEVYLALDPRLNRRVALKFLSSQFTRDPERVRRFRQEAQAASSLNHPNILTIHEVGEHNGVHFIVSELVEGETLRERMSRGPLPLADIVGVASQVGSALRTAHAAGVIHRDIKPENIMVRPDGYVKVVDFGLAKLSEASAPVAETTTAVLTAAGVVMGTTPYASPEQLRGQTVDARTDQWSLGVVLYELLSGRRPFEGPSGGDVVASILTKEPAPLRAPEELRRIATRLLRKNRDERYATTDELLADLSSHRAEAGAGVERKPHRLRVVVGTALLIAAVGAAWPLALRAKAKRRARASVPIVESLVEQRRYFEAYDLAGEIRKSLPDDDRITRAFLKISDQLTVTSDPAGANVYLRRFTPDGKSKKEMAGVTPIDKITIARGDYIVYIEKPGYAPIAHPLTLAPLWVINVEVTAPSPAIDVRLTRSSEIPSEMVRVRGGDYRLVGWQRPTDNSVKLSDFLLDRDEVSNRDFADFVRAGGYRRSELWTHPFIRDGKSLSFSEAMSLLRDSTGLAGPRAWAGQKYPDGQDDYPVVGVTWHEAAAYAKFRGKKLPTIFQWDKAARNGLVNGFGSAYPWGLVQNGADIRARANFSGTAPMPVQSMDFGISPFGARHMAGNVAEWCRNSYGDGFVTLGGAWDDPPYQFGFVGQHPGFYSSPKLGFRCAKESDNAAGDQGELALTRDDAVARYAPVTRAEFERLRARYKYPKTPLEARVVSVDDTPEWRREKITFRGAKGKTVIAYLFVPTNASRPLQVIHFVPASDVIRRMRALPDSMEYFLAPHVRAGRAAFGVVLEGYIERERPSGYAPPPSATAEYGDLMIDNIIDLRRGIDYLETRPDIDKSRIAYFGPSAGADFGVVITAVDDRYRSVYLTGAGVRPRDKQIIAVANKINFAPYVLAPKLMSQGRYDEVHPLRTEAEPLFRLFPEPKRLIVYEGGHAPIRGTTLRTASEWFDETLGPVKQ